MSRSASLSAAALAAGILVMAIVAASTLAGASGWVKPFRLEAGHGPVAGYQAPSGQPWWICAAATESRGPCR